MRKELKIGNYRAVTEIDSRHNAAYYFRLYDESGKDSRRFATVEVNISGTGKTKTGQFGKLNIIHDERGTAKAAFALDVMRHFMEDALFKEGVREISGSTNITLASAMEKRGWVVENRGGYATVSKTLSPEKNPKPWVHERLNRPPNSNSRKYLKKKPLWKKLLQKLYR
jgi:hypothetical protein